MTETEPRRRPTAAQAAEMLATPPQPAPEPEGYWAAEQPSRRSRAGRNLALALGVFVLAVVAAALVYAGVAEDESSTAQPDNQTTTEQQTGGDQPAGTDGSGTDSGAGQGGADGGAGLPDLPDFDAPDLPDFDAPDLPDLPDLPSGSDVGNDARSLWEQFKDWVAGWF